MSPAPRNCPSDCQNRCQPSMHKTSDCEMHQHTACRRNDCDRNMQMSHRQSGNEMHPHMSRSDDCSRKNAARLESMNRMQLLCHINEVSFAVNDITLYLDTHPTDQAALAYAREMVTARKHALKTYARRFGPLTVDCTNEMESTHWEWVMQPFPWEPMTKGEYR